MGYEGAKPLVLVGSPGLVHQPLPRGFHILELVQHLLPGSAFVLAPDSTPGHAAVTPHTLHSFQTKWISLQLLLPTLQISQCFHKKSCEVQASDVKPLSPGSARSSETLIPGPELSNSVAPATCFFVFVAKASRSDHFLTGEGKKEQSFAQAFECACGRRACLSTAPINFNGVRSRRKVTDQLS